MEEKVKVLIADDNELFSNAVSQILTSEGYQVYTACNGIDALDITTEMKPDAVLLDIIMPQLDGFGYLKLVSDSGIKPEIIVALSASSDEITMNAVMERGVQHYLIRPQSPQYVSEILKALTHARTKENNFTQKTQTNYESTEAVVTSLLYELGIPAHFSGFRYLREAIISVIEDISMLDFVTKNLYPQIAKKFSVNYSRVERSMRHAIRTAWDNNSYRMSKILGRAVYADRTHPSNSEFIAMAAEKIRLERTYKG